MLICWGSQYTMIYNDGYRPILGKTKHPAALGSPIGLVFTEAMDFIGPRFDNVMARGEDFTFTDQLFILDRNDYIEECYFTFSYSPAPADDGVGGVLVTALETTDRVLDDRRRRTLRDLATDLAKTHTEQDVWQAAATTLVSEPLTVPFAALYSYQSAERTARLVACAGGTSTAMCPALVELKNASVWPFDDAVTSAGELIVTDLAKRFPDLPPTSWGVPPDKAVILPIMLREHREPAGFLIAGISPRREFDEPYRQFFRRTAEQIATGLASARAYEEERRRAEALAEIDRAKTLFFSNVSHEFRTPLTLMLGRLEELATEGTSRFNAEQHEHIDVARRNALRLLKLVNTLLDFSRIEAGRVQAVYELTDLGTFTAAIASAFRSAMEKAGLRFSVHCAPVDGQVYVDRDMWEKIVLNLLSNAFKFTFAGDVAVSLRAVGDSVEFSVQDTGVGIGEEEQARVFERFHRVENARARTYEGTGIGLALVQELVKLHSGTVRLESMLGRGSTFTVSIPLGKAHLPVDRIGAERTLASTALAADAYVDEAERWLRPVSDTPTEEVTLPLLRASPAASPVTVSDIQKELIVIADDNADMRDYLVHLLHEHYTVHAVADGKQALESARKLHPVLVLADVMMPELDGFGVLSEIRSDPDLRSTPVILLSARAGEESRVEGLQAGADDYLVKPFTARELIARVSAHVKMANLRREAAEKESRLRAEAELERRRLQELLAQAPAAIGLMSGPEHRWVYVNHDYVRATGRTSASDFVGKTVRESLPEIETQPFIDLLDDVYRTGKPYVGREVKALLRRSHTGQPDEAYFDFVYQPVMDAEGKAEGILIHAVEVTDKIIARNAIKETAERLQLAQTAAQIGTWEWDPVRNTRSLSLELHRRFGTEADDPTCAEKWAARVYPPDWPKVQQWMAEGHRSGDMDFEYRYEHPDLGLRWFYCKGRRFEDETRMFGIVQDITQRKQAEAAVHESEERFRTIVETTPECVKLVAADGMLLQMNSAGLEMVGADCAEMVIGKNIYDVIAPEDRERFRVFNEDICRGKRGSLEFDIIGLKGVRRHMATHAAPMRTPDGSPVHLSVTRDITQRKLAEQALRESEQKLRVVTDAAPVMIWMSGTDKLCFYFNKSWLDFVGRTLEQEMGNGWAENVHPDDVNHCVQIYVTSFDARQPFEMEYRLRHRSGQYRWILNHGVPRFGPDGTFEGYVGGCLDIHDKKEAVERTRIAAKAVRRNNGILELQKRTLEMLVQGEPLTDVLSVVARAVRQLSERNMTAAIHLLNESGTQFEMAIAPDLPENYRIVTEGMPVATKTGPCCWAVLTGEPVVVANVAAEERWSEFARFASPLGIRSAASLPIRSAEGTMLATLAMYGREEGLPSSEDLKLMEVLTRTIALAIERQRTQDELSDSEGRLRLAQQVATIGTFEWDPQTKLNRWTSELEAMYGLPPGGFAGTQEAWEELVHPDDRASALKQVEVGFHTGAPVQGEWRVAWPDGSIHWILGRWQVFKNEDGQPVRMTGINIDITAQKKAEEALRTSEERFRALVSASSYVMYRMSPDWSEMWQLDGRGFIPDTQQAIENWIEVYIHPDDQPKVLAAIRTAIKTKTIFELEHRVRRVDGTLGWTASRAVPLLDNEGNIVEWFGAATDVSARREAEEAQRRLAVIVKSSDDAIISKDLNGIVTSWNPAAEKLFGYSAQEMIGRSITAIIPTELQHDEQTILATIGRGEIIDHFDTVRLTKSGERIHVSVTISPIRDEAGNVIGAAKIARDITRQKQAEQALRTTERLAAVGRLAATVAHEINNPLAAVTNLVYLSRQQAVGREIREFLTSAEEELQRIAHLTKQTLGFYRESKTPVATTLGSVVESTISVFAPRTRNKGITIRSEIKQDPEIYAGPSELRQLVGNLLGNSIDAVESGGRIRIRVSAVSKSGLFKKGVRLTIADSGSGIPEELRAQIFAPFFTTKKDVGTGLGLWICKGIVERYSGSIRIWSSTVPGRSGTIISVVFPISNQEQAVTDALRQAV